MNYNHQNCLYYIKNFPETKTVLIENNLLRIMLHIMRRRSRNDSWKLRRELKLSETTLKPSLGAEDWRLFCQDEAYSTHQNAPFH